MTVDGTSTGEYVTKEAVGGANVVLTIDSNLQSVTQTALKNNIEKIKKYGEILDIACARLYLCKRDPEHNTKVNINQI